MSDPDILEEIERELDRQLLETLRLGEVCKGPNGAPLRDSQGNLVRTPACAAFCAQARQRLRDRRRQKPEPQPNPIAELLARAAESDSAAKAAREVA
jgi:hypothetical protein